MAKRDYYDNMMYFYGFEFENEEYLDEIRNGSIVCEGINVEEIKNTLMK